ncbi:H-NS family nucleoid-associated regulatory protein [Casimicrobium huifangae]|uniref:H-NS histone family protein n=1 Tax=Casimicrobium huifangae TaxID=2591109 RepID=UPI0012EC66C2|nr:H-NS histone family protein [Casimicrobium huifangae]
MTEYQKIQQQIVDLQRQAAALWDSERSAAIRSIIELINTFDIKPAELGFGRAADGKSKRRNPPKRNKIPVKYQDGAGNAWTGRGLQPGWLKTAIANGATLESFAVKGN